MNAWRDKDKWVQFVDVQGLIINGGGQIDGQGHVWWKDCDNKNCQRPVVSGNSSFFVIVLCLVIFVSKSAISSLSSCLVILVS